MLLLVALAALYLATGLFSETLFKIKAFEFTASLVPFQRGETVILIPPLGKLRAATHWAPFMLKITLNTVDLERLSSTLQEIPDLSVFLTGQIRERALYFSIRLATVTFLCGAALLLLIRAREKRPYRQLLGEALKSGLLSLLLLALLLGTTLLYPYRISAFSNPRFEGALVAAPWIVELSDQLLDTVNTLSEQFGLIAVNLEEISARMKQLQPAPEKGEIRVLHVSDIHNNPAALELIEKIAGGFQVDLIIDTGDLVDYGSSLEAELAARLAALPQPYLFLPGNHDTPQSVDLLRSQGALIVDREPLMIGGLRIAGLPDPGSANATARIAEDSLLREISSEAAAHLAGDEERPDILALHNPLMAGPFLGELPLILSGHTHRAALDFDEKSGSILINAGTSGAAGMRGLLAPQENPYSMVVLYFNPDSSGRPRLTCADLITIEHFPDSFSLQRYYNHLPVEPPGESVSLKEDLED